MAPRVTEATGGGGRAEMERRLIQRSLQDESFRQRLLEDPKAAVEQESAQTIYLLSEAIGGGGRSG